MTLQISEISNFPGCDAEFKIAFERASAILAKAAGHVLHRLECSVESPGRYALLVDWRKLEDHTAHFRYAPGHQDGSAFWIPSVCGGLQVGTTGR